MSDPLGVGLIGSGWMARAHAHGLHSIDHIAPLPRPLRLVALAGRRLEQVGPLAAELGFERWTTSWEEVVEDPEVEVVGNVAPNHVHAGPSIAALELAKPVLCEKPLGRDAAESRAMAEAAARAGVPAACAFNYRFVPAVRLARQVIGSGRLGRLRHFRAVYLQDWALSPDAPRSWRFEREKSGSGALGDYVHLIDLLRYLAGEPATATAVLARFIDERPDPGGGGLLPVDVDDAYATVLELEGGALATLEASRVATGWKGRERIELNGERGSLWWDLEDLNRLHVFFVEDEEGGLGGFRDVLVTEPDHPYLEYWWAPGHILGWEHTFMHQWRAFLEVVLEGRPVSEHQATFQDGHRAAVICDAILEAARSGKRVEIDPDHSPPPRPAGRGSGGRVPKTSPSPASGGRPERGSR